MVMINATIAQKPFTMGYYGLRALDEIYHYPPAKLEPRLLPGHFRAIPGLRRHRHG